MKTVLMTRDHEYRPVSQQIIVYRAGNTYQRVPEAAVRSIVLAGAGVVVDGEDTRVSEAPAKAGPDADGREGGYQGRDGEGRRRNRRHDAFAGSGR